jgi:hypothetical protein
MSLHTYITYFVQICTNISEKHLPRSFSVTFQKEVSVYCLVRNVISYILTYPAPCTRIVILTPIALGISTTQGIFLSY